jgi:LuxR family maltose regulon positive regulatory protein
MLTRLYDHPRRHLLAARLAVATGDDAAALSALRDRRQWSPQFRVEAEVLIAAAEPWPAASERLTKALTDAAAGGWVSPFLSPGDRVATLLRKLPVQSLHPELARVLLRTAAGTSARGVATIAPDHLTPRELRLLHFLPSHLSYAEIGERLFISVNTVKTNLKALYRKLGATTRAEAVEAASVAGLLTVPDAEHEPASTLH